MDNINISGVFYIFSTKNHESCFCINVSCNPIKRKDSLDVHNEMNVNWRKCLEIIVLARDTAVDPSFVVSNGC